MDKSPDCMHELEDHGLVASEAVAYLVVATAGDSVIAPEDNSIHFDYENLPVKDWEKKTKNNDYNSLKHSFNFLTLRFQTNAVVNHYANFMQENAVQRNDSKKFSLKTAIISNSFICFVP